VLPFQLLIAAVSRWLQREQGDVIEFLREENRLLKARLAGQRLRFEDGERRRLAELGHRLLLDVQSRRVQVIGCTPYPDDAFVMQCFRQTTGETGLLDEGRILLCDRDPKWSGGVERWLATAGVRVVRTPLRAPNCNAYAERFVRSVKEECLNRIVPLGERHLQKTLHDFATHYHRERNHQGLGNELIERPAAQRPTGIIHRRQRMGRMGWSSTTTSTRIGRGPRSCRPYALCGRGRASENGSCVNHHR
jgi:transposase InsO family protein